MPVPDILAPCALGIAVISCGMCGIALRGWRNAAQRARDNWSRYLDAEKAEDVASKKYQGMRAAYHEAELSLRQMEAAETARADEIIRQHYSDKAIRSNRSPKRAANRAAKLLAKEG